MVTLSWINALPPPPINDVAIGTPLVSTTTSITPLFAQATASGDLLVAWLSTNGTTPFSTTSSGWVQACSYGTTAIFYKPNCGNNETAPTFTQNTAAGSGPSFVAQVAEFSGAALSSPVDSYNTTTTEAQPSTAFNTASDSAAGDLIVASGYGTGLPGISPTALLYDSNGVQVSDSFNAGYGTSTQDYYAFAWAVTTETGSGKDEAILGLGANGEFNSIAMTSFKQA